MRLSAERINSLQLLLKDIGLDYTDEEAQTAGLAIMRFALVKTQQELKNINDEEGES